MYSMYNNEQCNRKNKEGKGDGERMRRGVATLWWSGKRI